MTLACPKTFSKKIKIGGSVSVHGACLTVIRKKAGELSFDVVNETFKRTTLGNFGCGDKVHLELPLKMGSRFDGHFVQGHVDGKGKILKAILKKNEASFLVGFQKSLKPFLPEKGSVAVDGVSLTVGRVAGNAFWLHLIPHTLKQTCFARLKRGDRVNLETDILLKRLTTPRAHYKL